MFLQTPLPQIVSELSALIERSSEDVARLQQQEKHLTADLGTTDHAIEEIVGREQKQPQ